jgi:hypothetical protein
MSTTFTVDFFCSVDGYGMATGWPGYWGKEGPEIREDRVRTFAQDQVLVFGATTFRQFRKFVVEYDEPYYDSERSPRASGRSAETRTRRYDVTDGAAA